MSLVTLYDNDIGICKNHYKKKDSQLDTYFLRFKFHLINIKCVSCISLAVLLCWMDNLFLISPTDILWKKYYVK